METHSSPAQGLEDLSTWNFQFAKQITEWAEVSSLSAYEQEQLNERAAIIEDIPGITREESERMALSQWNEQGLLF